MTKYAITAASFTGQVTYLYDNDGYLNSFIIDADLNEKQKRWFLDNIPKTIGDMADAKAKVPAFKVVEVPLVVTFDMMWDKYNDKSRSSRLKSLKSWSKMNETDQLKAYNYIHTYNRNRGQAEKKHLTTYLSDQLWNN